MSWFSKVVWSEGLFLRPHHLQQHDRYFERLVENRSRYASPYPWGFADLEIDRDLAQQNKFGLRRAAGVLPDGTPFDMPADSALPLPITVPESAAGQPIWLLMPMATANSREVDGRDAESASRHILDTERLIDSTSPLRIEEEIEIAHPRLSFEIRKTAKPGYMGLLVARVVEVADKTIIFDEKFAPPVLRIQAHPVPTGWLDRVIGWVDTKLEELARYASDPSAGGGLQGVDYFMLQTLNRTIPALKHLRRSKYVHPERLYIELLQLAGELATFATKERRTRDYGEYDHDQLEPTFAPLLDDIQRYLNVDISRAIRLAITERAPNAFVATVRDRNLFRNATFVLEVAAKRPLTDIQRQFPELFKVGPNTKMNEIVHAHLPGIALVHMPTPPAQIRSISSHVYFYLDRTSPLWPEFSTASGIGMHFSGDWPELALEMWAIKEDGR
jgi:type VI secretion system protein ImpJ